MYFSKLDNNLNFVSLLWNFQIITQDFDLYLAFLSEISFFILSLTTPGIKMHYIKIKQNIHLTLNTYLIHWGGCNSGARAGHLSIWRLVVCSILLCCIYRSVNARWKAQKKVLVWIGEWGKLYKSTLSAQLYIRTSALPAVFKLCRTIQ